MLGWMIIIFTMLTLLLQSGVLLIFVLVLCIAWLIKNQYDWDHGTGAYEGTEAEAEYE